MEYPVVIDDADLERAVSLTREKCLRGADDPITDVAADAVASVVCTCVAAGEDAAEGHPSTIHAMLIESIVARVADGPNRPPRGARL